MGRPHEDPGLGEAARAGVRREVAGMSLEELRAASSTAASRDRLNFERATAARVELFSRLRLPRGTVTIGSGRRDD
jgi:hypothetical protein